MNKPMREDWNEKELKRIAKGSGVKQTVADVSYMRFLQHHSPAKAIVRWFVGGAFLLCSRNKSSLHIIGIACVKEWQHKGVGSYLLSEAIKIARKEGYPLITTRSKAGADFYVRKGFDVTGMKGGDFLLELKLN